jgi:hypothetical protein
MTCEIQVGAQAGSLGRLFGNGMSSRLPAASPKGACRVGYRCPGDPPPEGATGQAEGAVSGDQAQLPGPRCGRAGAVPQLGLGLSSAPAP